MVRFVIGVIIISSLLLLFPWLNGLLSIEVETPSYHRETVLFMAATTVLIYTYLVRFDKAGFFLQAFLLSIGVKLLAGLTYLLIIVLKDRVGAPANAILFVATYIIFTGFEIAFLYPRIRASR